MKINNQIKEIEKGCGEPTEPTSEMRGKFNFSGICGQEINKNVLLCPICRVRFELLKQFQKQIKELQGDLVKGIEIIKENGVINPIIMRGLINKRFKNKFGDLK
jgi:hypothetical protein